MAWKRKKKEVKEETKTEDDKVAVPVPVESPKVKPVEKEVLEDRFTLQNVATQTESYIYDDATGEQMNVMEAMIKILNDLDEIKDFLEGT